MSFPEWEKVKRTHSDSRNALIELAAALTRDAREFTSLSDDLLRISNEIKALEWSPKEEVQRKSPILRDQVYSFSVKLAKLAAKYGVSI